jgi:SOS-response transcriptional repressor LexA
MRERSGGLALRVQGTSMQPVYQPGDIIIINPEKQYKHGSDVVAMQADGTEVTFKRLSIEEGGKMYLKPLNRDFEPRMMLLTGKIIGVCIGRFTEMDD